MRNLLLSFRPRQAWSMQSLVMPDESSNYAFDNRIFLLTNLVWYDILSYRQVTVKTIDRSVTTKISFSPYANPTIEQSTES